MLEPDLTPIGTRVKGRIGGSDSFIQTYEYLAARGKTFDYAFERDGRLVRFASVDPGQNALVHTSLFKGDTSKGFSPRDFSRSFSISRRKFEGELGLQSYNKGEASMRRHYGVNPLFTLLGRLSCGTTWRTLGGVVTPESVDNLTEELLDFVKVTLILGEKLLYTRRYNKMRLAQTFERSRAYNRVVDTLLAGLRQGAGNNVPLLIAWGQGSWDSARFRWGADYTRKLKRLVASRPEVYLVDAWEAYTSQACPSCLDAGGLGQLERGAKSTPSANGGGFANDYRVGRCTVCCERCDRDWTSSTLIGFNMIYNLVHGSHLPRFRRHPVGSKAERREVSSVIPPLQAREILSSPTSTMTSDMLLGALKERLARGRTYRLERWATIPPPVPDDAMSEGERWNKWWNFDFMGVNEKMEGAISEKINEIQTRKNKRTAITEVVTVGTEEEEERPRRRRVKTVRLDDDEGLETSSSLRAEKRRRVRVENSTNGKGACTSSLNKMFPPGEHVSDRPSRSSD